MKRLVVTGPRRVEFEEVPVPTCPKDGLLVKAAVTAISTGTELRVYRWIPVDEDGRFLYARVPLGGQPIENGYSMVGKVVEVGDDASGFAVGDRVFLGGSHKEYAATPAGLAVRLPEGVSDEQAVFLNILGVGQIALRNGSPTPGENVAVLGLGVVGISVLAFCTAFGFRTAAADLSEKRLAVAREMGAELTGDPSHHDFRRRVKELFDGVGADLVVEAASTWKAIRTGMDIVRTDGRIVVAARHTDRPDFNPVGHPYLGRRITLRTSYGFERDGARWDRARSHALTLDLLSRGRLRIGPMITHHFRWHELPEVYARLDQGDQGIIGTVIHWQ